MNKPLKTRFAPTPSGYLHAGNGVSFIITWALARTFDGSILLRIDDLDAARRRLEYLEDIFQTLNWLGLDYDEGASGVADFLQNYSQHTRLNLYNQALRKLQNLTTEHTHDLIYACRCSRRKIQETARNGIYPNTCRTAHIDLSAPDVAWRLRLPEGVKVIFSEWQKGLQTIDLEQVVGDFVVYQKNRLPAYQLASVIDDDFFGINFVVRGADLLPSTAAQIFISAHLEGSFFSKTPFSP
ncbi:MAG: tRNA glutamyl-Q synthetase [Saprospiraceae bacterium]|nr:tRNA glutamyl-Q synthetase [Saprospiraceae bacterium]